MLDDPARDAPDEAVATHRHDDAVVGARLGHELVCVVEGGGGGHQEVVLGEGALHGRQHRGGTATPGGGVDDELQAHAQDPGTPYRGVVPEAVPPGWPEQVLPPQAPDWELSAVAWLFDQCPPEYRAHDVLRTHPVVLARFAREHVASAVEAARVGYRTARADLRDLVAPEVVDAVLGTYDREGRRLVQAGRAVSLVEAALRGERWVPRL